MVYAEYYIRDSITRLQSLQKRLSKTVITENDKSRLTGYCLDLMMAYEELSKIKKMNTYNVVKTNVKLLLKQLKITDKPEDFKEMLQDLIETVTMNEEIHYSYDEKRNHTEITKKNMDLIFNNFLEKDNKLNILDTTCDHGINIDSLSDIFQNSITYGVCEKIGLRQIAKNYADKTIAGTFFGNRISNNVFDIVFLQPAISYTFEENKYDFMVQKNKKEKNYIQNSLKYAREDGVITIVIPYYRLYKDMCLLLSKNLKNLQIRKLENEVSSDLIVLIGQKSSEKQLDKEIYGILRNLNDIKKIESLEEHLISSIQLKSNWLAVDLFRGSILDESEITDMLKASKVKTKFWEQQDMNNDLNKEVRPLLPFNVGQIGLVLTSGSLDGIIEEENGSKHVIKGRVIKKTDSDYNVSNDNDIEHMIVEEIISNKVEINVLMPNGEFKILT